MQSILQSRRFRKQVQCLHEQASASTESNEQQHKKALRDSGLSQASTLFSASSISRYPSVWPGLSELEKANAPISNADDGPVDPRDTDIDESHEPASQEVEETLQKNRKRAPSKPTTHASTGISTQFRQPGDEGSNEVYVVGYENEHDKMNPRNWSRVYRSWATLSVSLIAFVYSTASTVDSPAQSVASEEFGVGEVVESMATGLFLVGLGSGTLFAAPVSETVGRNPVYFTSFAIFMAFTLGAALAPNIGAQLAFRFLAGFFGCTPISCVGGTIADLWSAVERVIVFPFFAISAFAGPALGPVVGGFVVQSRDVSWRWNEWAVLIVSGVVMIIVLLLQPETYTPVLLSWKAKHMRAVTGDDRYVSDSEVNGESLARRLRVACCRPFVLMFCEPVIFILLVYLTVIYIVFFTFTDGYEYIFADVHGTNPGITGLCFLGIIVGLFLAAGLIPLMYLWAKKDLRRVQEQGGSKSAPEIRLWYCMLGAPAIPISLFWMAWTSYPSISVWSPLAASVLFGYGILCIFISSYQYVMDSYELYSASAIAGFTVIRYIISGGMVVVGVPFYRNMGVHWTLTIMGAISALLVPAPYLFYLYGRKIRAKSKYAVSYDAGP